MRARFSALCVGDAAYLWKSLHSQHDDRAHGEGALREALAARVNTQRYRNFRLLDEREKDAHGTSQVLYGAEQVQPHRTRAFVELASFVDEAGAPRYIAGVVRPADQLAHGVDELSIDHWDCGHDHHH
jgi:SEC-C motif-containing protein